MDNTLSSEILDEILETAGLYDIDIEINEAYSGRGMYGVTCLGISFRDGSEVHAFLAAAGMVAAQREAEDRPGFDALRLAKDTSMDSMGLGTVVYWRGWKLEG